MMNIKRKIATGALALMLAGIGCGAESTAEKDWTASQEAEFKYGFEKGFEANSGVVPTEEQTDCVFELIKKDFSAEEALKLDEKKAENWMLKHMREIGMCFK